MMRYIRVYIAQLNWKIVLLTFAMLFLLLKLGMWQINRAEQKEQRLARIAELTGQAPMTIAQVLASPVSDINDLPVVVDGTFNSRTKFLLDNQTNNGRLGYRVLQVLEFKLMSDDKAINALGTNNFALLVNLGWVEGFVARDKLPEVKYLTGSYQFIGHIRVIEKGLVLAEQNYDDVSWPLRVQQIELDKFSSLIGKQLLPFVVFVDKDEALGFEKNWQPIVMPPEKHRAYAFQWFSLAIAWLALMLSASIWFGNKVNKAK